MDCGFYFEETKGLFNKSANEKVSSNLGHRSQIGRLSLDRARERELSPALTGTAAAPWPVKGARRRNTKHGLRCLNVDGKAWEERGGLGELT